MLTVVIPSGRRYSTCMDRRAKIIALNDRLRTTFAGGRVQALRGIFDLDDRLRGRALCVLSRYDNFAADSDHNFGSFVFAGYAFEWQIEYRNPDGRGFSADPADPKQTLRLLTLYPTEDILIHKHPRYRRSSSLGITGASSSSTALSSTP